MNDLVLQINDRNVLVVTPDQNLIYSSAEHFKMKVFNSALQQEKVDLVIVRGDSISLIDATAVSVSWRVAFGNGFN